jgi:ribosomal protein L24
VADEVRYAQVGDDVAVVSGPHEGRKGRIVYIREVSLDNREAERYAIVEYSEKNCFDEVGVDHISVPVRRLAPRK